MWTLHVDSECFLFELPFSFTLCERQMELHDHLYVISETEKITSETSTETTTVKNLETDVKHVRQKNFIIRCILCID